MGPLDALWHLSNLLAIPVLTGGMAAAICKLVWRTELRRVSWVSLALWAAGASVVAVVLGLLWFGRDGRMVSYAAMVAMCAAALWWRGFRNAGR